MAVNDRYKTDHPPARRVDATPTAVAACWCDVETHPVPDGAVLVIRVAGEVDTLTLPVLADALDAVHARAPTDVVVDVAGVTFCSARGYALLAHGARTGIGYAVSGLTSHADRIASIVWADPAPRRFPSAADAVITMAAGRVRRSATSHGDPGLAGSPAPGAVRHAVDDE